MKYVSESFDAYVSYLEENRDSFPEHIYAFAADVNRHNLDSPHSLHDAWMTSITIQQNRNRSRPFGPEPTIEVVLLGQKHDRDIILRYKGVESYQIAGLRAALGGGDTFQGDVSRHEVRLGEAGLMVHEIEFSSNSRMEVVFRDLECIERLYT